VERRVEGHDATRTQALNRAAASVGPHSYTLPHHWKNLIEQSMQVGIANARLDENVDHERNPLLSGQTVKRLQDPPWTRPRPYEVLTVSPYLYGERGNAVPCSEMVHETRVVPTDGRPHIGKAIKTYMGNSVGHWDGNTLVVETTNLRPESATGGRYTDAARVVERFTRTAPDQLLWEATISDPNVWTRPYTLRYPFQLDPDYKLYEYACHEGNYMMLDALKGARDLEAQGRDTKVVR
jgi:hypothetical protein